MAPESASNIGTHVFYNNELHPDDRRIFQVFAAQNYPGINTKWDDPTIEFITLVDKEISCIVGIVVVSHYDVDVVHIRLVAVDEGYRNRGLGTRLLAHVAARHPSKKITLNVDVDRKDLIIFYSRKGYAKREGISDEHRVVMFSLIHENLSKYLHTLN